MVSWVGSCIVSWVGSFMYKWMGICVVSCLGNWVRCFMHKIKDKTNFTNFNEKLREGWEIQGGVCYANGLFVQAIIRVEEKELELIR
jgi:hypothetical protein